MNPIKDETLCIRRPVKFSTFDVPTTVAISTICYISIGKFCDTFDNDCEWSLNSKLVVDIRCCRDYQLLHLTGAKNVCCTSTLLLMRRMLMKLKSTYLENQCEFDERRVNQVYIYGSKLVDASKPVAKRFMESLIECNCQVFIIQGSFFDLSCRTPKTCGINCNDIDGSLDYSRSPTSPMEGSCDVILAKMSMILPGLLFIGNERDSRDAGTLKANGIKCIVNVTNHVANEFEDDEHMNLKYLRLPADDSHTQNLSIYFDQAADFIHECIDSQTPVLVHCWAGISRSCTIVIAYLIKYQGMAVMNAFDFVRARRPIVQPNLSFLGQLDTYLNNLSTDGSKSLIREEKKTDPFNSTLIH